MSEARRSRRGPRCVSVDDQERIDSLTVEGQQVDLGGRLVEERVPTDGRGGRVIVGAEGHQQEEERHDGDDHDPEGEDRLYRPARGLASHYPAAGR